ncbi:MAG: serine hydrolase [Reinekea sp.]
MKKILLVVISTVFGLVALLLILAYAVAGFSPVYLYNAPSVATGIGAKLACSMRYITGYEPDKIAKDIEVYSPILTFLDYRYNDAGQYASSSFLGKTRRAQFYPGIGCALEYFGHNTRATIQWPLMQPASAAWPKGNSVLTIQPDIQKKLDAMLAADNADGHDTRALLVVHNGNVVAESYANGITSDTPLLGWSMSKSVTSLLLWHLEMQGIIDVDEDHLFPAWQNDERANIRVEDMLQLNDGLDYEEKYDPGQVATKMLFQSANVADVMLHRKAVYPAGEHHEYSSGTANLVTYLVQQRIEGGVQSDVDAIVNGFFRPLGMTSIYFETDPDGFFMGSSYLYATARDWAKIGQLMLNGGEINDHRLVSEDYIQRALTPNASNNEKNFGYLWWLNDGDNVKRWPELPDNTYAALGSRDQRVLVMPDDDLVIVRLGWSPKRYITDENFSAIRSWFQ